MTILSIRSTAEKQGGSDAFFWNSKQRLLKDLTLAGVSISWFSTILIAFWSYVDAGFLELVSNLHMNLLRSVRYYGIGGRNQVDLLRLSTLLFLVFLTLTGYAIFGYELYTKKMTGKSKMLIVASSFLCHTTLFLIGGDFLRFGIYSRVDEVVQQCILVSNSIRDSNVSENKIHSNDHSFTRGKDGLFINTTQHPYSSKEQIGNMVYFDSTTDRFQFDIKSCPVAKVEYWPTGSPQVGEKDSISGTWGIYCKAWKIRDGWYLVFYEAR
ncbi:hypothetical protein [Thalassoglobus sp.]|uniref:hypothetical protein n=1 Tax=Thalassoglobus sp. TaxID=2795869 RepID=UPI003AA81D04